MTKAFTLLELIVVIVILGILAALSIQQYFRVTEKSRSSEAKQILGQIREKAAGYYTDTQDLDGTVTGVYFDQAMLGISVESDAIPSQCRSSYYFSYSAWAPSQTSISATATRCASGGKTPDYGGFPTVQLDSDFGAGAMDTWSYSGEYQ